jgi:hypothetical protein
MMALRAVVALQIAWVSLSGALCRGLFSEVVTACAEKFVLPLTPIALVGFPVLVLLALRRVRSPESWGWAVASLEAALTLAYLLAVLPSVQ